jgi:hypothetical protein
VEAKAGMTCDGVCSFSGDAPVKVRPRIFREVDTGKSATEMLEKSLYLDLRCEIADSWVVIGLCFLISGLCWGCNQIPVPPINPERPNTATNS